MPVGVRSSFFRFLCLHSCIGFFIDGVLANSRAPPVRYELKNKVHEQYGAGNGDRQAPLRSAQAFFVNHEHGRPKRGDDSLGTNDDEPKANEHWVGEYSIADVDFVVDHAASDHVELLHQHKGRENPRQMARDRGVVVVNLSVERFAGPILKTAREDSVFRDVKTFSELGVSVRWLFGNDVFSGEEEGEQDADHPERHSKNMLLHLARQNVVIAVLGHAVKQLDLRLLGGKREGGQ